MSDNIDRNKPFGAEFLVETPLYTLSAYERAKGAGSNDPLTTYCGTSGGDNSTTDSSDGTDDHPQFPC
jgi:hypothetical protein